MIILQINQAKVKTLADFNEAIASAKNKKQILLLIRSKNITKFVTIKTIVPRFPKSCQNGL